MTAGQDWIVACTIATEVPPFAESGFTGDMIDSARRAVAEVILNRVGHFAPDPVQVCLQPKQFSAVCSADYWRKALAGEWEPQHVTLCEIAWETVQMPGYHRLLPPETRHYFSPVSMKPSGAIPSWWSSLTEVDVPEISKLYYRFARG